METIVTPNRAPKHQFCEWSSPQQTPNDSLNFPGDFESNKIKKKKQSVRGSTLTLGHYDNLGLNWERLFLPVALVAEVDAFTITIYPSCGSLPLWVIHWATLPVQLAQMRPQPERYLASKEFSLFTGGEGNGCRQRYSSPLTSWRSFDSFNRFCRSKLLNRKSRATSIYLFNASECSLSSAPLIALILPTNQLLSRV